MDNLLSGFIGALIGGVITFLGAMWQTSALRAAERERRELETLERVRRGLDAAARHARDLRDEFLAVGRGDRGKSEELRASWIAVVDELRMLARFYAPELMDTVDQIHDLLGAIDRATVNVPTFTTAGAKDELAVAVGKQAEDVVELARPARLKLLAAAVTIPRARRSALSGVK